MKPSFIGALTGALLGFLVILLVQTARFEGHTWQNVLYPMHVFNKAANGYGPFGQMMFGSFAYFGNMLLYAAIGYGIGWLFESKGAHHE